MCVHQGMMSAAAGLKPGTLRCKVHHVRMSYPGATNIILSEPGTLRCKVNHATNELSWRHKYNIIITVFSPLFEPLTH